jgi:hypothetical protein
VERFRPIVNKGAHGALRQVIRASWAGCALSTSDGSALR